ncbi:unnamed protein product, partial [Laminaria digitata]
MVRDLVDYVVDKNNHLVGGFQHARQASVSQENIDTYPEELKVPSVLMKLSPHPKIQIIYDRTRSQRTLTTAGTTIHPLATMT